MKLGTFTDNKQHNVSTAGTESKMTIEYLKDVSTTLAIIPTVREGGLRRLFSAEREILKLFAFDRINYAG